MLRLSRDWSAAPTPFRLFVTSDGSTAAAGLTAAAGPTVSYSTNDGSTWTTVTLVTGTLGTYASGGFVADSVTGFYWLGLPILALPEGGRCLVRSVYNSITAVGEVRADGAPTALTATRATALPSVASGTAGSLPTTNAAGNVESDVRTVNGTAANTPTGATSVTFPVLIGTSTYNGGPADLLASTINASSASAANSSSSVVTTLGTAGAGLTNVPYTGPTVGTIQSGLATSAALATLNTAVANLNNLSALELLNVAPVMEVPASGSIAYPVTVTIRSTEGLLTDLSAAPTLAVTNAAGTDRSANLSAVTHAGTGRYAATYTVPSTAAQEGLSFSATGTAAGDGTPRYAQASAAVVAVDTGAALTAIQAAQSTTNTFLTANVGQNGANLTAVAPAGTALSSNVWTAAKAGYLDTNVASRSAPGAKMDLVDVPSPGGVTTIAQAAAGETLAYAAAAGGIAFNASSATGAFPAGALANLNLSGGLTAQQVRDALRLPASNAAGGIVAGSVAEVDGSGAVRLPGTVPAGYGYAPAGPGMNRCTLTVASGGAPLAGATLYVTSDAPGKVAVAGPLTTDANGSAVAMLAVGTTYYLWATAAGENAIEGQAFVAVADG